MGSSAEGLGLSLEVRATLALLSALFFVLLLGRPFIRFLAWRRVLEHSEKGDSRRLDEIHAHKSRTPTMGGAVLFAGALLSASLWARLESRLVLLFVGYVLSLAILGFLDDSRKQKTRQKGLSARAKLFTQVTLSLIVGLYLYLRPLNVYSFRADVVPGTALFFPFFQGHSLDLGTGFVLLVVLVTTGSSNAVNLTDGLDGLAVGLSLLVAAALLLATVFSGHGSLGPFFHLPVVEDGGEIAVCLAALMGGGMGFLRFNSHPAQIFMGDTGALPLGGALGLAAVALKQEVLLFLVGGVLVAEAGSVMLQVAYYKMRGKRIFLCAPLHHHFQFKGWHETRITRMFWTVGAMLALASLAALRLGLFSPRS